MDHGDHAKHADAPKYALFFGKSPCICHMPYTSSTAWNKHRHAQQEHGHLCKTLQQARPTTGYVWTAACAQSTHPHMSSTRAPQNTATNETAWEMPAADVAIAADVSNTPTTTPTVSYDDMVAQLQQVYRSDDQGGMAFWEKARSLRCVNITAHLMTGVYVCLFVVHHLPSSAQHPHM